MAVHGSDATGFQIANKDGFNLISDSTLPEVATAARIEFDSEGRGRFFKGYSSNEALETGEIWSKVSKEG